MEELLQDFLAETTDNLEQVGAQIVHFEREPSDLASISSIFRLVHTIKGTCGFLDLSRLESLAHGAESLIGAVRDRAHADAGEVSLILQSIDRIRTILTELEATGQEPAGDDSELIASLLVAAERNVSPHASSPEPQPVEHGRAEQPAPASAPGPSGADPASAREPALIPKESATIRVTVATLERIMRLASELVLTRNQLLEIARNEASDVFNAPLQRLSGVTSDLQEGIMHARMQPIDRLFNALPRMVRDLSAELGKKVELIVDGADTELDRQLIEQVRDPLTHLVRNCLDHGIEAPQERRAIGKTETGLLRVSAAHDSGHITIRIEDDGRGIDVERVREKALAQKLASDDVLNLMSNDEICRFIFAPGFSTASAVTHISGRGIGMDVVRENIEAISGSIALSTSVGRGTTFVLKIPLTLAIAPALIFTTGGQRFALPQHMVMEAVALSDNPETMIRYAQGEPMLDLRHQIMPLANLNRILGLGSMKTLDHGYAIVVRAGSRNFAIAVEDVADVQEIVLQPQCRRLAHIGVYSGHTILGDGSVVLILNPGGIADAIGLDASPRFQVETAAFQETPQAGATNLILFKAGAGPQKAVPLSLVSRIEMIEAERITQADGRHVARRDGALMPLIVLGDIAAKRPAWPVLIVGVGGEPLGILVDEIIDILESKLDIDISGSSAHVIGSADIGGSATEVLDLAYFMKTGRPDAFERGHARKFRVLLVDDKIFFRDLLAPVISASGYEVHTAASAAEAFAFLKRGIRVDVLVSDIDMPEMDGYSFARQLQDNPKTRNIPIVALDAYAGPKVIEAAMAAGMKAVVGKFDRQTMLKTLQRVLEGVAFQEAALEQREEELESC